MLRQQRQPDGARIDAAGHQAGDENQVAEGLTHLLALEGHHAGVSEDAGKGVAGEGRGVSGGELVVRKDQVAPAAVHRDRGQEVLEGDDGALHVPAGAASADRRVPCGLAGSRGAPEQRIERIALARSIGVSPALGAEGEHGRPVERALLAELPGRQNHGTVEVEVVVGIRARHAVCGPVVGECLHRIGDVADHIGDGHVLVGRDHAQRFHVVAEQFDL